VVESFVPPDIIEDRDGMSDMLLKELVAFKRYIESNYNSDVGFDLTMYWSDSERVKTKVTFAENIVDYGNLK
jgi:hypothetical protein